MEANFQDYVTVKFKRLNKDAVLPTYAKPGDAGLDITTTSNGKPHESDGTYYVEYDTGLAVEIPTGFVGLVFPRSSISLTSYYLANAVGVIDSGYRGEIKFRFRVDAMPTLLAHKKVKAYHKGDKIGQLIVLPYPKVVVKEASDLSITDRGAGGFGSTTIKGPKVSM